VAPFRDQANDHHYKAESPGGDEDVSSQVG
jgi:hypothetical protein